MRKYKHAQFFVYSLLAVFCVSNSGCATFSAAQLPQRSILSYVNRQEQRGLAVAAESFYTREKSNNYFDTDLTKRYVVPVFFVISNKSDTEYAVDIKNSSLSADNLSEAVSPMTEDEVAKKIKRGAFWRTFGWCMIVPIFGIPAAAIGSTAHTSSVNKRVASDIKNKNLAEVGSVGPNDTIRGIIFFDVSKDKIRALDRPVVRLSCVSGDKQEVLFNIQL